VTYTVAAAASAALRLYVRRFMTLRRLRLDDYLIMLASVRHKLPFFGSLDGMNIRGIEVD
jgi:hypothetical protein